MSRRRRVPGLPPPERKSRPPRSEAGAWKLKAGDVVKDETPSTIKPPPEPAVSDEELFRRAVETLEEVPDKDQPIAAPPSPKVTARKAPKKLNRKPDASLDLHGQTVGEARGALLAFLTQSRLAGHRMVHIVTGKGYRSTGGKGVLKGELERWVRDEGQPFVSAFSEAPRTLGGSGAYLLYLR